MLNIAPVSSNSLKQALLSAGLVVWLSFLVAGMEARAQENVTWPTYFKVVGVADNDVLNVRGQPNSSAPIVGELAPNSRPIEVLASQNGWAQVSTGEGTGWVSTHFLEEIQLPTIGDTALPEGLRCGGTEPFWGLEIDATQVVLDDMNEGISTFPMFETGQFANRAGSLNFFIAAGEGGQMTGIISNRICSDGMSDRDYGRAIELLISTPGGTSAVSGCCSVFPSQ